MKQNVMLTIRGVQRYMDQEPEVIELVTEGMMEYSDGGWDIRYEESDLTGLGGVTTEFRVEPDRIVLTRTGKLSSQMIFQEGIPHDSLYEMGFGALMLTVCATKVDAKLNENGGTIDLVYSITVEQSEAGEIEYHLDINAK